MASSESVGRGGCRSVMMISSYTQPIIRSFSSLLTESFVCACGAETLVCVLSSARHEEGPSGERRVERFLIVVTIEDRRLPGEEIGVRGFERCEVLGRIAFHPFVDQQQVSPGDGVVIQARTAVVRREALQRFRETLQRLDQRQLAQVDPGQPDVIAMMKRVAGDLAAFKSGREFFVVHLRLPFFGSSMSLCESAALSVRP